MRPSAKEISALETFIASLRAQGERVFLYPAAGKALGLDERVLKRAVNTLIMNRRLMRPCRQGLVILPAKYQDTGAPPPEYFIDSLMRALGKPYYAAMFTAAHLHGAPPLAPEEFRIFCGHNRRLMRTGATRIEFTRVTDLDRAPVQVLRTSDGMVRVSTPEATAIDLVLRTPGSHGRAHLRNAVSALSGFANKIDPVKLLELAKQNPRTRHVQRLGYLLELAGASHVADALAHWFATQRLFPAVLVSTQNAVGAPFHPRWQLFINENLIDADTARGTAGNSSGNHHTDPLLLKSRPPSPHPRPHTPAQKLRVVEAAETRTRLGELGVLCRTEHISYSTLSHWRRAYAEGGASALAEPVRSNSPELLANARAFLVRHPAFSIREFDAKFVRPRGLTRSTRSKLIEILLDLNELVRVRNGLYAANPPDSEIDPVLIAARFSSPCVLAFQTALQVHGVNQPPLSIYHMIVKRQTRPLEFRGWRFQPSFGPFNFKSYPDFGGHIIKVACRGLAVRATSVARSIVDCLDRIDLTDGIETLWRVLGSIDSLDVDDAVKYACRLDSPAAVARLGYYLESQQRRLHVSPFHLRVLRSLLPVGNVRLDGCGPGVSGPPQTVIEQWKLSIPVSLVPQGN